MGVPCTASPPPPRKGEDSPLIFEIQKDETELGLSARKLYPNFKFEEPYGYWIPMVGKVTILFPFFKQIIMPITPYLNKEEVGLSINQIIELYKNGFMLPLISYDPKFYSNKFIPLFQLKGKYHVPSTDRFILINQL